MESNATCLHITHWKPLWKYNKIASCNFFICKLCHCFQIYKLFLQETDGTYQPRTRQFIFIFEKTRQFNLFVRRHRFKYMHFQTFLCPLEQLVKFGLKYYWHAVTSTDMNIRNIQMELRFYPKHLLNLLLCRHYHLWYFTNSINS